MAANEKDKSIKVFAFDRISNLSVLHESFDNYNNYFDDYFGIVVRQDKEIETIRIKMWQNRTRLPPREIKND